jgi:putative oxidoreductase
VFELSPAIPESRTRAALGRLLRALPRLGLAALFVFVGYTKFDGDPRGAWYGIFEQIGLGQWFRVFAGVVQVTGAVLVAFRRTVTAGAVLLGATMLGAAAVDIFLMGSPVVVIPLLLLFIIATVWVTSD